MVPKMNKAEMSQAIETLIANPKSTAFEQQTLKEAKTVLEKGRSEQYVAIMIHDALAETVASNKISTAVLPFYTQLTQMYSILQDPSM